MGHEADYPIYAESSDPLRSLSGDPSDRSRDERRDLFGGSAIIRVVGHGRPGNPVIFPQAPHARLKSFTGDSGARHLIETSGVPIINVNLDERACIDVDMPEEVAAAGGMLRPEGCSCRSEPHC